MGFFDNLEKSKGGFIFLSHSHDDIEKVREIRNALEKDGFEPLCFYLKCLNEDSEVEDLIKREIDAREWFVFVNSENSRKSKWVTIEREYITKTNKKKIITVDLDDSESITETLQKIKSELRVFMSYSHHDVTVAHRIKNKLEEKDYLVFLDEGLSIRTDWEDQIVSAIIDASKEGCVLALLTENSIKLDYVKRELKYAIYNGGNVLPVFFGDVKLEGALKFLLGVRQAYYLPENPTDEEIEELVDKIGNLIVGH